MQKKTLIEINVLGYNYVPVKLKLKHPPQAYPRHLTPFPVREGGSFDHYS